MLGYFLVSIQVLSPVTDTNVYSFISISLLCQLAIIYQANIHQNNDQPVISMLRSIDIHQH